MHDETDSNGSFDIPVGGHCVFQIFDYLSILIVEFYRHLKPFNYMECISTVPNYLPVSGSAGPLLIIMKFRPWALYEGILINNI